MPADGEIIAQAWVRISPDLDDFRNDLNAKLRAALSGLRPMVKIGADTSEAQAKIAQVAALADGTTGTIRIGADTSAALAAIEAVKAAAGTGGTVRVGVDTGGVRGGIDAGALGRSIAESLNQGLGSVHPGESLGQEIARGLEQGLGSVHPGQDLGQEIARGVNEGLGSIHPGQDLGAQIAQGMARSTVSDVQVSHMQDLAAAAGVSRLAALAGARQAAEMRVLASVVGGVAGGFGGGGGRPPETAPAAGGGDAGGGWLSALLARRPGGGGGVLGQVPLFGGIAAVSGLHLALDAAFEAASLLVTSVGTLAVGLAALGAVAAPTIGDIKDRMTAVYDVSQATGHTIPPLTGAFQNLADAMAPTVVQGFGDALTLLNTKSGALTQLIHWMGSTVDRVFAQLVVDFQHGQGGLATFFHIGEQNAAGLGTVFENVGHAIMNLIRVAETTHLAEDFLVVLQVASRFLVLLTEIPKPLLAAGIAMHAVYLWGGLAATAVARLAAPLLGVVANMATAAGGIDKAATATSALGDAATPLQRLRGSVQDVGAGFGALPGRISGAGKAMEDAGTAAEDTAGKSRGLVTVLKDAVGGLSGGVWAAVAVGAAVGLGALIFWLARSKDAAQKWAAAQQEAINKANAFTVLNRVFAATQASAIRLAGAQVQLADTTKATTGVIVARGQVIAQTNPVMDQASQKTREYTGIQSQFSAESQRTLIRLGALAGQYGGLQEAMGLVSVAGVKLSDITGQSNKNWLIAQQQIAGLVTGYAALGQQGGLLGNDLNAVSFATSIQDTQIQKMTQSWQTFMSTLTGGESSFVSFQQGMQTLNQQANATGLSLGVLSNSSIKQLALASGVTSTTIKALSSSALTQLLSQSKLTATGLDALNRQGLMALASQSGLTIAQLNRMSAMSLPQLRAALIGSQASMSGLNTASLQLRSTYESQLTAGSNLINQLTTEAAASGTASQDTRLLAQAGKDVVAQLIPFARGSKQATDQLYGLAQQAGYTGKDSLASLTRWAGDQGATGAEKNLNAITGVLTGKMSDLATDAKNLSSVLNNQLTTALDKAFISTTGVSKAAERYTRDILDNGATIAQTAGARRNLFEDLATLTGSSSKAKAMMDAYNLSILRGKYAADLANHTSMPALIENLYQTGLKAGDSSRQVKTLISDITRIPLKRVISILVEGTGKWSVAGSTGSATYLAGQGVPGSTILHARAEGGPIPGRDTGKDSVLLWGRPGEYVLRPEAVRAIGFANLEALNKLPGLAAGGPVGMTPSGLGAWIDTHYDTTVRSIEQSVAAGATKAFTAATAGLPGNVAPWLTSAIRLTNVPMSWLPGLEIIAKYESGGNPQAVNLSDINAQRGDPSRGLMQMIGTTFAAYALPGLTNILNPIDNAVAAIRYILADYGSVWNVPGVRSVESGGGYVGYAGGGVARGGRPFWVGERGPELLYSSRDSTVVPHHAAMGPAIGEFHMHAASLSPDEAVARVGREVSWQWTMRQGAMR